MHRPIRYTLKNIVTQNRVKILVNVRPAELHVLLQNYLTLNTYRLSHLHTSPVNNYTKYAHTSTCDSEEMLVEHVVNAYIRPADSNIN